MKLVELSREATSTSGVVAGGCIAGSLQLPAGGDVFRPEARWLRADGRAGRSAFFSAIAELKRSDLLSGRCIRRFVI